jgi:phage shock protein PspC (stress-responsive transcriptional regulator)
MNKTVTINISGIIFHIEEDAYERLSRYLSEIKRYFSGTEGGNEIMGDIESRIAELLQARLSPAKQVVLMSDVEYIINVMGKPEDFGAEPGKEENSQKQDRSSYGKDEKIRRRLFRNPDEKALGGVCSGLAAYFNIDTVWVRLAMFLLIFFGGLSIWVYIILWIVIPEARTTADRLAMRGEQANINTIFRSFQDEAEEMKNRGRRQYEEFRDSVRTQAPYASNTMASVLNTLFNIMGRLVGLFLIFIGGVLLVSYVASVLGISILDSRNQFTHWRNVIFGSSMEYALGVFAFMVVVGIPVIMLIYAGVKLLFKIRYHNRWLNLSLGLLWTIGLLTGVYVTVTTVQQFNENSRLKETFVLRNTGDTLVIKMNKGADYLRDMKFDNSDDLESFLSHNRGGYFFGEGNKRLSVIGFAGLNVTESNSDSIEMTVTRSARGYSKKDANENARAIEYTYRQDKNVLIFDELFMVEEGAKFRMPRVAVRIRLPRGKVIYFDKSTKYLLDDIDNTSNTWDGKMISRRWKMTDKGLECIDCDGLGLKEKSDDTRKHRRKKEKVIIDEEGIEVNGEDTEIKINDEGIRIRTSEEEVDLRDGKKTVRKRRDS